MSKNSLIEVTQSSNKSTAQRVYDFIRVFQVVYGRPPTLIEIGAGLGGLSKSAVVWHIQHLRASGLLRERVLGTCRDARPRTLISIVNIAID